MEGPSAITRLPLRSSQMAEASTVWMIHSRTGLDGVKGVVTLEGRAIVFRPAGGRTSETVIPLENIRRVRRALGSPVLELHIQMTNAPPIVAFYFVQPPHLHDPSEGTKLFGRYLSRRKAIGKLRAANAEKREEVELWVAAIEQARPT
jgi:hypothetical protein